MWENLTYSVKKLQQGNFVMLFNSNLIILILFRVNSVNCDDFYSNFFNYSHSEFVVTVIAMMSLIMLCSCCYCIYGADNYSDIESGLIEEEGKTWENTHNIFWVIFFRLATLWRRIIFIIFSFCVWTYFLFFCFIEDLIKFHPIFSDIRPCTTRNVAVQVQTIVREIQCAPPRILR